jgi:aminopeptidase N
MVWDLVTAQSGKHHWLQEGFATYYALAEREIYGDDYFYSKLYETAQQIKYASRTDTIPVLNEKASSLSFYQKGLGLCLLYVSNRRSSI